LTNLPADETAVFQDEVDVHLNPKIGPCWMKRGEQATVITPGNNEKRHLAGSLVWRTGTLAGRQSARDPAERRPVRHPLGRPAGPVPPRPEGPRDLRQRRLPPGAEGPGVLADVGAPDRPALPASVRPETNPIERVWWRMHETVTRNHRCPTLDDLLCNVYSWIERRTYFYDKDLAGYATAA